MNQLDDMLAGLSSEGALEARREFQIDSAKAREKLQKFQLEDPHFYVLEPIKEEERTLPLPTEPDPAPPAGDAAPEGDGEPDGQPPSAEAEGEGAEAQPDSASTEPREDAPAAAPEAVPDRSITRRITPRSSRWSHPSVLASGSPGAMT